MKAWSGMIMGLAVVVCAVMGADETNRPSSTTQAEIPTNRPTTLRGFTSRITILKPDAVSIEKVRSIRSKLKPARSPRAGTMAPRTLEEAADFLSRSVAMAWPPGACVEIEGVFYFSGGTSTQRETNFISGFAIKKGDTSIQKWEMNDDKPEKK